MNDTRRYSSDGGIAWTPWPVLPQARPCSVHLSKQVYQSWGLASDAILRRQRSNAMGAKVRSKATIKVCMVNGPAITSEPTIYLGLEAVSHACGASTHVGRGQNLLGLAALADLCDSVDNTADEANEDGGHTAKGDGRVKEDEAADGDGELVQSTDHGVGGGRSDADTPGGCVRDEDGTHAGDDHDGNDAVAQLGREALCQIFGRPVFDEQRSDEEDRDGKKVVVVHG